MIVVLYIQVARFMRVTFIAPTYSHNIDHITCSVNCLSMPLLPTLMAVVIAWIALNSLPLSLRLSFFRQLFHVCMLLGSLPQLKEIKCMLFIVRTDLRTCRFLRKEGVRFWWLDAARPSICAQISIMDGCNENSIRRGLLRDISEGRGTAHLLLVFSWCALWLKTKDEFWESRSFSFTSIVYSLPPLCMRFKRWMLLPASWAFMYCCRYFQRLFQFAYIVFRWF